MLRHPWCFGQEKVQFPGLCVGVGTPVGTVTTPGLADIGSHREHTCSPSGPSLPGSPGRPCKAKKTTTHWKEHKLLAMLSCLSPEDLALLRTKYPLQFSAGFERPKAQHPTLRNTTPASVGNGLHDLRIFEQTLHWRKPGFHGMPCQGMK